MELSNIEQNFREKVCEQIRLVPEGINRFRVFTPFLFDDGDHLSILLKQVGDKWILTDETHTYMHLTYVIDEKDLQRGTRQSIISNALAAFSVTDKEGELLIEISNGQFGNALYSYIQALLKITDVSYLTRERVHSTFLQDFRAYMEEKVPAGRLSFDWSDSHQDPAGNYSVDCRVNGMQTPLFVYAINSDGKARDTTIALLQFERWGLNNNSVAIFENQEEVNRKVLARFSDVCEKQFSSLDANKDRINKYLDSVLSRS
jgi:hypothetical protein